MIVDKKKGIKRMTRLLLIVLLSLLAAALGYVILTLPKSAVNLQELVAHNVATSGVSNPVTAVLLNFRAYDTFLEMVVLLVAMLGVWSIKEVPIEPITDIRNPVLDTLSGLLVPFLILFSAYLLWVGAHAPGGAFQAGSVLGAALVLLLLSGRQPFLAFQGLYLHFTLVASTALFTSIALFTLLVTGELLKYPLAQADTIIFILESIATISIGLTLALLFFGIYAKQKEKQ